MTEHEKARAWRVAQGLTIEQLGDLIGYSVSAIGWFERGKTPPRIYANQHKFNRKIDPKVWLRYKRACHSVSVGKPFNWEG